MDELDEDEAKYLQTALENENNQNITKYSIDIIKKEKSEILEELCLPKREQAFLTKRLKGYRYINDLDDITVGRYIRWINLTRPEAIKLTNGGIICEIKIEDGTYIVCKNNMNRLFQINFDENLIFQKLTDQESIILMALDNL